MIEISALHNMFLWMKILLGMAAIASIGALVLIARERIRNAKPRKW